MTIALDSSDPRVSRIRAILFAQHAASDPVGTLWEACTDAHREVLVAIAERGEITQPELEQLVGISAVTLRGRNGGLARLAKRVGVEYPILSTGGRRSSRRFSLSAGVAHEVLKLNQQANKRRNGK
ncbi:MAG TPA: hypothetical protein VHH90_05930 [Polyangia bacterium]|nr:hypothetical protein [Polyangia bacterium]